MHIKVNGAWKEVKAPFLKVGGVWKPVQEAFLKVNGAWKPVYTAIVNTAYNVIINTPLRISMEGDNGTYEKTGTPTYSNHNQLNTLSSMRLLQWDGTYQFNVMFQFNNNTYANTFKAMWDSGQTSVVFTLPNGKKFTLSSSESGTQSIFLGPIMLKADGTKFSRDLWAALRADPSMASITIEIL